MTVFSEWLARKLDQGRGLKEVRTAEGLYDQMCTPRWLFARIKIVGFPAEQFAFKSEAQWPPDKCSRSELNTLTDAERNEEAILDGAIDELVVGETGQVVTHVQLTLLEVECGKHSPPFAFYMAARLAVRKIMANNVTV
jgi:hypothetical protein